jgi:transposase InsO family protein
VFAIVSALLGGLIAAFRPRASLVVEIPRASAAARRAQARQAPATASPHRQGVLDRRLPRVVAMGGRTRDREAGDRDRVAPPRFRSLLGLEVEARRTAAKYMLHRAGRTPRPPSQTWGTFIRTHAVGTIAIDFFTVPTVTFGVLYVFFVLSLERRRVIHVNVTEHPTAEWAAQQIVGAVGPDVGPARLMRDRDKIFGAAFDRRVDNLGLTQLRIAPRSPWQNGFAERWVGTARREIVDHLKATPRCDGMSSRLRWDASSRPRGSADSIIATGGSRREHVFRRHSLKALASSVCPWSGTSLA